MTTPAATSPLLEVQDVSANFGPRQAVDKVTLALRAGETLGLLGPNGSGKSTLLKLLCGLKQPSGGAVRASGQSLAEAGRSFRRRLGVVFQSPSLDPKLSCAQNLALAARIHGLRGSEATQRIEQQLKLAKLSDRADEKVANLSGGMRRRLDLVRALLHRPDILLLDEPSSGLDEQSYRALWEYLEAQQQAHGLAIIVATHRADEAERCHRVAVFDQGKLVIEGAPDQLKSQDATATIEVETATEASAAALKATLVEQLELDPLQDAETLFVSCTAGPSQVPRIADAARDGQIRAIRLREPSMADAYLRLVGKALSAEADEVSN